MHNSHYNLLFNFPNHEKQQCSLKAKLFSQIIEMISILLEYKNFSIQNAAYVASCTKKRNILQQTDGIEMKYLKCRLTQKKLLLKFKAIEN